MHIQLDRDHTLSTDKYNFIISEYREQGEDTKEPGKVVERPLTFCTSLEAALKSYSRIKALNSKATSLDELQDTLNEIDENIKTIAVRLKL
mgnify:CR=1 FL=1